MNRISMAVVGGWIGLGLTGVTLAQPATTAPAQPRAEATDMPPEQMVELAIDLLQQNQPGPTAEGAQLLDRLTRIAPKLDKLPLAIGLLKAGQKNTAAESVAYFIQYTTTTEGRSDYRGYYELGKIYLRSRSLHQARRNLEQAKEYAPEKERDRYVRAEILIDLSNVVWLMAASERGDTIRMEAVKYAREAATMATKDPKIQIQFGQILLRAAPTEYREARDTANKAIAQLNNDLAAYPRDEAKMRLLREAVDVLQKACAADTAVNTDNPESVSLLAAATRDLAAVERRLILLNAWQYAQRARTLKDNKTEYKLALAEIEADLGATRNASERVDEVLKAEPENAAALALKERIRAYPPRRIGG